MSNESSKRGRVTLALWLGLGYRTSSHAPFYYARNAQYCFPRTERLATVQLVGIDQHKKTPVMRLTAALCLVIGVLCCVLGARARH